MSVLASDNFNRSDGGLGANWTTITGQNAPQIASNQVVTTSVPAGALYTGISWPNDQYSQMKLVQYRGILIVRGTNNVGGEASTYYFVANTLTGAIALGYYIGGVGGSDLDTDTITVNANDVLYLEVVGTSLIAKINGSTVLTATDSSITTGTPGFSLGNVSGDTADDWEGGDFAAGNPYAAYAQQM